MLRSEKAQVVQELSETLAASPHVFVTHFRGLSANQATELRRRVRVAGGRYKVIKNRLARRAAEGKGAEQLSAQLTGPCAFVSHPDDPVGLAKVLSEFAKDNPQVEIFAGLVDARDVIDGEAVKRLSTLPGLPDLRAQLLALILTPATMLVRLIGTPGTQLARVVDARRESLEGGASE